MTATHGTHALGASSAPITPLRPVAGRALRGVQVVEGVGSSEALAVLKRLAKGEPRAPLTRDAGDALKRLARRPAR